MVIMSDSDSRTASLQCRSDYWVGVWDHARTCQIAHAHRALQYLRNKQIALSANHHKATGFQCVDTRTAPIQLCVRRLDGQNPLQVP